MQHIIPFYLFFCVAGGIAALVLLFLVYSKNPRKDLFYFSLFFVAMTCNIFTNLVLIYRSINITGIFGLEDYLLALAGGPFSIVFFSAGPMAVHRILAVPYEKWGNRILIVINIVAFIIQYFPTGISYDVSEGILIIGPLYTVTALTQLAIIVYIIILLLAGFHRIQDKVVRSLLFRCGIVTLLFMPGFIHDITYSMSNDHFNIFPVDMVFFPLYYLFLAVMVIIYAGRYLIEIKLLLCSGYHNPQDSGKFFGGRANHGVAA